MKKHIFLFLTSLFLSYTISTCSMEESAVGVKVTDVILDQTTLSLTVGGAGILNATVLPEDASKKDVTWESSNTNVATVSNSGVVSAVAIGTATITVKTKSGGKTASCNVTVSTTAVSVASVSLNKTSTTLAINGTEQLTCTILPTNATNKGLTWSSSNANIATVSNNGLVTAKAVGTATITVKTTDGNKTASCTVTVTSASVAVTSVSLNKTTTTITIGNTEQLTPNSA